MRTVTSLRSSSGTAHRRTRRPEETAGVASPEQLSALASAMWRADREGRIYEAGLLRELWQMLTPATTIRAAA